MAQPESINTDYAQPRLTVNVLGVDIDAIRLDALLDYIIATIQGRRRAIISNVNVYALNLAWEHPWFRDFLNQSDLVFCDGFGVKWGARLLGYTLPERFTPPDWLPALAERCRNQGFSLFLLGARPGVVERAATALCAQIPGLRIAGTHHGHFDHTPGSAESEAVAAQINRVKPDVLLIGFGMPLQERWLWQHWGRLDARVALPVGAAFDYLSGNVIRGPRWMTDYGLEWLSRLVIEPRRLWRRYMQGNPIFLARILRQRLGLLSVRSNH